MFEKPYIHGISGKTGKPGMEKIFLDLAVANFVEL